MTADNTLQRRRYNLLKALQENDPDSEILKDAIAPIEETPNWDRDHPLPSGAIAANIAALSGDPFTPGALKETTAEEFVARLVESQRQSRPAELVPALLSVQELTRQDFDWGHGIARELARRGQWSEPVWKDIISGWSSADLEERQCRTMLEWFSNQDVFTNHAGDVAESLHRLVRNGGRPYAVGLIDEAEQAALPLWQHIRCDEQMPVSGWHDAAFNFCNVGYLTRFWLDATEIRTRTSPQPTFSSTCMRGLNQIIEDGSLKGDLGTAVLAGQADFLLQMQQPWTELFFQPVFNRGGSRERAAWGGLVETQNITPGVARALGETLQEKFTELIGEPVNNTRQRELFAGTYTKFLCYYAPEPGQWLKATIDRSSTDVTVLLAQALENRLKEADPEQHQDWWRRWMRDYWTDRNIGLPKPISPEEGTQIAAWTAHLTESFAEAVDLAKRTPWSGPPPGLFQAMVRSGAASKHPDLAADLLTCWSEKSEISATWATALEVLDTIEQAQPGERAIEETAHLRVLINDQISVSGSRIPGPTNRSTAHGATPCTPGSQR